MRQSPQLRPARYNLAVARYRVVQKRNLRSSTRPASPNIDAVLADGPASVRVLYLAASVYAVAQVTRPGASGPRRSGV